MGHGLLDNFLLFFFRTKHLAVKINSLFFSGNSFLDHPPPCFSPLPTPSPLPSFHLNGFAYAKHTSSLFKLIAHDPFCTFAMRDAYIGYQKLNTKFLTYNTY